MPGDGGHSEAMWLLHFAAAECDRDHSELSRVSTDTHFGRESAGPSTAPAQNIPKKLPRPVTNWVNPARTPDAMMPADLGSTSPIASTRKTRLITMPPILPAVFARFHVTETMKMMPKPKSTPMS